MPGIHTDYPFETDNRAYRRFLTLVGEHFNVVGWDDAATGRPTLITLIDVGSGDAFTVALVDSIEDRARMRCWPSPPPGTWPSTARSTGRPRRATTPRTWPWPTAPLPPPAPLHHPDTAVIDHDGWLPVPAHLARVARPASAAAGSVALVLLDRTRAVLTVVGPLPDQYSAQTWLPTPDVEPRCDRLIMALHPVRQEHHAG